jgi:2-polyprenyl-3-methyl-5-hydroxy-6-metoxy-1,4-benzoquinol methylase
VFVPPDQYLSPAAEKAEYDKHQNSVEDQGYRQFLSRLAEPLLADIPPASRVLEFGCGPGPALANMLQSAGHHVTLYDAFYYPDSTILQHAHFDVVTATEVIEHLHHPAQVMSAWFDYLAPQGHIGIMTKTVIDADRFAHWHYKNDPTHVCFYSTETFDYIASKYGATWRSVANDAFIFKR